MGRLVINGDEIYELDESCIREKKRKQDMDRRRRMQEERQRTKPYSDQEEKP